MKQFIWMLALLSAIAGCSSDPVKEAPKSVTESTKPEQLAAPQKAIEPRPESKSRQKVTIVSDPIDDPRSPLAARTIYYDYDSSNIKSEYQSLIQAHAKYLVAHRTAKIRIEGNCDERGSREYNLALGQRRAEIVKNAFKIVGVLDDQMETVSWGEEKPKANGHDEAAWAKNRRSEIAYVKAR